MGCYRCEPAELVPLGDLDLGRDTDRIAIILAKDRWGRALPARFTD